MGSIRKEELHLASAILKIPTQQVKVLDHPDLQAHKDTTVSNLGWAIALFGVALIAVIIFVFPSRSGRGVGSRRRNVLLVIAHPDDESMFFAPTINYLISSGHNVHILCISTGGADGMGSIRKEELHLASAILKIPTQQVKVLDHPDLQDGFGKVWDWNLLAGIIYEETCAHAIDLIVTFDNYGVSGHCNHRDVHQGVRKLLHDPSGRHLEAWELVSTNIARKYSGPVDIWLSTLLARGQTNRGSHCLINLNPRKSYAAMAQHASQWVWYRKLFVSFSSYTYVNTLEKILVSC